MTDVQRIKKDGLIFFPICFALLFVQSVMFKLSFSVLLTGAE